LRGAGSAAGGDVLGFEQVRFYQFRNWGDEPVDLGEARQVVLSGENGQGKTNFLEGIYLLCYGSSFRTKNEKKLCLHGTHEFSARGRGTFGGSFAEVSVKLTPVRKELVLNGEAVRDRKELVRRLPCVAFTHEDYHFVSGGPEFQRYFFDQTLSLFDVLYIDTLRHYRRILKIRNALLVQPRYDALAMDVYEHQLALAGLEITRLRREAVEDFNPLFTRLFGEISGLDGECRLKHLPSWKDDEAGVVQKLAEGRDQDARLGFTSTGPHRDRFAFQLGGRNFADHASTGQVRLLSLLLRISQATLSLERTGRKPLLLLDDVLLELDGERRRRVLANLPPFEQAFFTFLPDYQFEFAGEAPLRLRVDGGRCTA
jgi:DNA replication and repair protein RecF